MADEPNANAGPNSMEFHSMHVESLKTALETLDENDEHAKVKVEIELSKEHWSELASLYYTVPEGPTMASSSSSLSKWVNEEGTPEWKLEVAKDNVDVFRSLQEKYPGGFFLDENDMGPNSTQRLPKWMRHATNISMELSSETPFAEGGQAELFQAHMIVMKDRRTPASGCKSASGFFVLKVFKEGMPFRDLIIFLPTTMLANDITCMNGGFRDENGHLNPILGARLMKCIGRFAFLMLRAWGDLRKLINERMLHFKIQGAPFLDDVALYILHGIAKGMRALHERDIIHRDLKAANVLVFGSFSRVGRRLFELDPIHLQSHKLHCVVADFECSVGIVGTGF